MSHVQRRHVLQLMLSATAGLPGWAAAAEGLEIEGFRFDPTVSVGGKTLQLNGAAISHILSVRTTVVALYLPRKQTTVEAALAEPGIKRLCFYSLREVSAKDLSNTFLDRLRKNATGEEISANFIQIAQFGSAFSNRSKLVRNDFVSMDYNPSTNLTELTLNGHRIGEPLSGESFFRMLMKIWMGPRVRPATREGLVGGAIGAGE